MNLPRYLLINTLITVSAFSHAMDGSETSYSSGRRARILPPPPSLKPVYNNSEPVNSNTPLTYLEALTGTNTGPVKLHVLKKYCGNNRS